MKKQPIGVMDSGIGGLTVWRELVKILPDQDYLYFGDSRFCPYGSKTPQEILDRVTVIVDFLVAKECKIIVLACNAITAASVMYLRKHYDIPFIGMEPAIKPALLNTRTNAVGVLATQRTFEGDLYRHTKSEHAGSIDIVEQVGHGLVERVEAFDFNSPKTRKLLRGYLEPMLKYNVDAIVLGCTHYPFLEKVIRKIAGGQVAIFDPAPAVARHTATVLDEVTKRTFPPAGKGITVYYTTGDRELMEEVLSSMNMAKCDVRSMDL